jgi:hypothetical protein
MYIQLTDIDATTGILCTKAPMRTGPTLPNIKGFKFIFAKESIYPLDINPDGSYSEMPLYYGICDDDADITLTGVIKILSEIEFETDKYAEHQARKPYPSWIGDIKTMSWYPPVPYPQDENYYYWDELSISWIKQTPTA